MDKGQAVFYLSDLILAAAVIGAAFGAFLARRRGGRGLDMLQYGAGFAIFFALICLFVGILISRLQAA